MRRTNSFRISGSLLRNRSLEFTVLFVFFSSLLAGCGSSSKSSNSVQSSTSSAPAISTQPTNQSVTLGQTVTFSVVASGATPLSYQWQKNGANISGATAATYTTPATTSADNGSTFDVVVSNSGGSVTSS